ncbi:MAG: 5-formyltetrahydrofolate cyclo-ligase [Planctomycetota bacterium]
MKPDDELFQRLKSELRVGMKQQLASLSSETRRTKSAEILARLVNMKEYKKSKTVLAYASFGTEVETDGLLQRILDDKKRLVLPRLNPFDKTLVLHHVTDLANDLIPNNYGIREPHPTLPVVNQKDIQLVAVPGLAFDDLGNRLGRGLGCYDRLIANAAKKNRFVGLAFDIQIVGELEIASEPNDMPVDYIVTESMIIDSGEELDHFYAENKDVVDEVERMLESGELDEDEFE